MRKAVHPLGGVGSSNPHRWRGEWCLLDNLCFLCGNWLVTRQSNVSYLRLRFRGVTKWSTQDCTIQSTTMVDHVLFSSTDVMMSPIPTGEELQTQNIGTSLPLTSTLPPSFCLLGLHRSLIVIVVFSSAATWDRHLQQTKNNLPVGAIRKHAVPLRW